MTPKFDSTIRMIPINQINVLNPRARGKKKFGQIIGNIAKLGLKKPITVCQLDSQNGEPRYNLICGQGRYDAFVSLGQTEIPAILVDGDREQLMIMTLAENLARRKHTTVELVRQVSLLKEQGYNHTEIAKKTDLDPAYVRGILQLLVKGEERLLQAVEKGQLPVSIAVTIATSDDKSIQRALQEAYEKNDLRGKALIRARRLIESRRAKGKRPREGTRIRAERNLSTDDLLKTFQKETMKQKMIVQKAKICETRLLFAVSALRQLFLDDHFGTLLRAEGLDTLPQYLVEQIEGSSS